MFDYLINNFDRVWPRIVEHVTLVGEALFFAILIALPLGLLLSRLSWLATPVLGALGVIYTIPSLALLIFFVPYFGIGPKPAIIALTAYALVVIVRNTMVAFNGVDPMVKEAARGMGMSGAQICGVSRYHSLFRSLLPAFESPRSPLSASPLSPPG